jgi:hypothetical protein
VVAGDGDGGGWRLEHEDYTPLTVCFVSWSGRDSAVSDLRLFVVSAGEC